MNFKISYYRPAKSETDEIGPQVEEETIDSGSISTAKQTAASNAKKNGWRVVEVKPIGTVKKSASARKAENQEIKLKDDFGAIWTVIHNEDGKYELFAPNRLSTGREYNSLVELKKEEGFVEKSASVRKASTIVITKSFLGQVAKELAGMLKSKSASVAKAELKPTEAESNELNKLLKKHGTNQYKIMASVDRDGLKGIQVIISAKDKQYAYSIYEDGTSKMVR